MVELNATVCDKKLTSWDKTFVSQLERNDSVLPFRKDFSS
jgi:hypothetical protein